MIKGFLGLGLLLLSLGACANKSHHHHPHGHGHGHGSCKSCKLSPEQHEAMAKIHQEAANCLKKQTTDDGKAECHKTMKKAKKEVKGSKDMGSCHQKSAHHCEGSSCQSDDKSDS